MEFTETAKTSPTGPYTCEYCGGSLDLRYYFCVHCARAYRDQDESVYGIEPPVERSLDRRIAVHGQPAIELFCWLAVLIFSFAFVRESLGNQAVGYYLLVEDVVIAALTSVYAISHWREIAHLFRGIELGSGLAVSLPVLGGLLIFNWGYHAILVEVLGKGILEGGSRELIEQLSPPFRIVLICVFPAVFEEIGFRGLIQERMMAAAGQRLGCVLSAFLFMALHFSFLSGPYLFLLGLFLSWTRISTRSIYPSMALHFIHNLAVLFVFPEVS